VEFIPPHNPLSDEMVTISFLSTLVAGASPNRAVNGCQSPREFSAFTCTLRSFEAATIFIALVIF
jgi:hypothetical protein